MSHRDMVHQIVRDVLQVPEETEIRDDTSLEDDLGGDSLDLFEIIVDVETEFDIDFTDAEMESIQTVGELVAMVDAKAV